MPKIANEAPSAPSSRALLTLFRIHVEATLSVMGRRKAERHLRMMTELIAREASLSEVLSIKPAPDQGDQRVALREAAATFEECLPTWVAKLPRE